MANSCEQPFQASVNFNIYDSDDFELDSDDETVLVPANGTVVARGTMLISPLSKAQRMSKQGASEPVFAVETDGRCEQDGRGGGCWALSEKNRLDSAGCVL